ncbi:phage holin family protein [Arthrobacter sp. CJ23]|uniref:phage holin family protein n=1 Tax=Arthrobacter sp. CJ23 TaxID=2972479 RepID=UPI00215BEEF7|nr:phage holin family protein [Arthrobacter sp. CJ23]UVJ38105.1 phage holin family protein [Arthrobacter sp. CJ23]
MKTWAIRIGIALVFNAITLWVASILPGVRLGSGFLWAVVVFTAATLLVKPAITALIRRGGNRLRTRSSISGKLLTAAAGLLATLAILILTSIFSNGFNINGIVGWVMATVVIWLASAIYDFVDDGLEARVSRLTGGRGGKDQLRS